MARSTQFIGLTDDASDFVKDLDELPSDNKTFGIAGEDIYLRRWKAPELFQNRDKTVIIEEVEYDSPWSSGPMIFTCLSLFYPEDEQEDDDELDCKTLLYQWVRDPSLREINQDLDYEKGTYWV